MAITHVKKSRKEYCCGRCGEKIPAGSEYLRGDLNFSRPIIRCIGCGLESWEVTTSDYQLRVGALVYRWQKDYSTEPHDLADTLEEIKSELEDIKSEMEDKLDSMPDGLRDGDTGCLLQDRIDEVESALDDLENVEAESEDLEQGALTDEEAEGWAEDVMEAIDNALSNISV